MKLYIATLTAALLGICQGWTGIALTGIAIVLTITCGIRLQFKDTT